MCFHILPHRGIVISWSTVQQVNNLDKNIAEVNDTFNKFDDVIHTKIKCEERGYAKNKPNPDDWYDLLEEYECLHEKTVTLQQ